MDLRGFNVVFRPEWHALPAKGYDEFETPLKTLVEHFNTESPQCFNKEDCMKVTRALQSYHQLVGLGDIHYNFLIGSDGNVYEGRGWTRFPSKCGKNFTIGEHIALAYIGDWTEVPVPENMLTAKNFLVNLMIKRKHLAQNYKEVKEKDKLEFYINWTSTRLKGLENDVNPARKLRFSQQTTVSDL